MNTPDAGQSTAQRGDSHVATGDLLAAEATIEKLSKQMADEFQNGGAEWKREWMQKHSQERIILVKARTIILDRIEAANAKIAHAGDGQPSK